jgi:hypothetical protein
MPWDNVFAAGSLATAYLEVAQWYGVHTSAMNAQTICQPFFGFGRMASAMLYDGVTIDTNDFQHLSWAIAEGVFNAKAPETNVDKPHYRKGKTYNGKMIKGMDERSAGFIDWVADFGSPLDIACVAMAIPGQTMRGWLSRWVGNFDRLYERFEQIRDQCAKYIPMPGTLNFVEGDFFKIPEYWEKHYDVLVLDPPRLNPTRDAYSYGVWPKVNNCLGGTVRIQPWTTKNYFSLLSKTIAVKSDYILMTWADGQVVHPPIGQIKTFVRGLGTIEDEVTWEARSQTIHGWKVNRQSKGDKW